MSRWHRIEATPVRYWLGHALAPLCLLALILALPVHFERVDFSTRVQHIELLKPAEPITPPETPPETPAEEPPAEPLERTAETTEDEPPSAAPVEPIPLPDPQQQPPRREPKPVTPPEPTETTVNSQNQAPAESPAATARKPVSSGEIFLSASEYNDPLELGDEFKAAEPEPDYRPREWQATDWKESLPYLDEEVDKPRVAMRFYAPGIEGSVERFFDKISIKKKFTTRYGTEIYCVYVALIVACSWK